MPIPTPWMSFLPIRPPAGNHKIEDQEILKFWHINHKQSKEKGNGEEWGRMGKERKERSMSVKHRTSTKIGERWIIKDICQKHEESIWLSEKRLVWSRLYLPKY